MRTKKEISTISYNSIPFLTTKLKELYEAHQISNWLFIHHKAEQDERKDHIHLFITPNTLLDTMDLQNFLKEYDPLDPLKKPLGCIDFRSSKIDDWILYNLHYEPYLAWKCESREFHYTKDDFFVADLDTWDDLYYHAMKGSDFAKKNQLLQMLSDNRITPAELVLNGSVPLNQASQLNAFYYMKAHYGVLDRGNHEPHE